MYEALFTADEGMKQVLSELFLYSLICCECSIAKPRRMHLSL